MKNKICFRADGNSQIGLGHVTRSLALADMLRDSFDCVFAIQEPTEALRQQIREVCPNLIELPSVAIDHQEAAILVSYLNEGDVVVLDGYSFETEYQRVIKQAGYTLVCIDDIHAYHFVADVVINHAGGVQVEAYSCEEYTRLCLGPSYALLRAPFLEAAQQQRQPDVRKALLCMGGADPHNYTNAYLEILLQHSTFEQIHVLIGSSFLFGQLLEQTRENARDRVFIHQNLDATEVCNLMRRCGVAICPPSSVAYEYCAVKGLLLLKQTADNQKGIQDFLLESGCALVFSDDYGIKTKPDLAQQISNAQANIFDGQQAYRYTLLFRALSLNLRLRKVNSQDKERLFLWANDRHVRQNAVHSEPIRWDQHIQWFAKKTEDTQTCIFILEQANVPVGQVRIEFEDNVGTIDYSLDPLVRGKGMGYLLIELAVCKLQSQRLKNFRLHALVKESNIPSCKVFEKLRFRNKATEIISHEKYFLYEKDF